MRDFVNLICLLYHEARNVRHPLKEGKLAKEEKYLKLTNLPNGRDKAWIKMAEFRGKVSNCKDIDKVVNAFQKEYGMGLDELLSPYKEPCWKNTDYGGNRWAPICSKIMELVEVIKTGDSLKAVQMIKEILRMEHNTGVVCEKLYNLTKAELLWLSGDPVI